MKFLVLSSNQDLIDSTKRHLNHVHSIEKVESFLIRNPEKETYQNFLVIRNWLENIFNNNDMTEMKSCLIFLDLPVIDCSGISVMNNDAGGLLSLLTLSFPEIYWFLLMPVVEKTNDECFDEEIFVHFHVLFSEKMLSIEKPAFNLSRPVENFFHGYTPLFDGTGFRHFIIKESLKQLKDGEANGKDSRPFLSEYTKKALVVDEEIQYSYLHAYVAYKFGHKTLIAITRKILDDLKTDAEYPSRFDLSFEDIYLSFPDSALKYDTLQQHSLRVRDKIYTFFKNIPKRIFVTIGEHGKVKIENRVYRQELIDNRNCKFYKMLYKPYAGIFNLQKEARLKMKKIEQTKGTKNSPIGHSQPGRLGMIADILIERSTKVLSQVKSSNDAIYAAMLALQAQEILGGRTATQSIKAISLKHQAEVMAECMFFGVEHSFDVKGRFKEIHEELGIIGRWFGKSQRNVMIYNSQLNIINELARIFRNYSQFDEEQMCLDQVRTLIRKIYRKRNKFWGWLTAPIRWYFEYLIGSLGRFLAAIILWPFLLTLIFYILPRLNNNIPSGISFINALTCSVNCFFALQNSSIFPVLSIIGIISGFFHLGIFISHLYTIVSRR